MMQIESLRPADWTAALQLALVRVPAELRLSRVEHCLHLLETGLLQPNGIWVARHGGDIVGVQVCTPLAGCACLFWLPTAGDTCVDPLLQASLNWCQSIGCKIAQTLASTAELPLAVPLLRHGFRWITRMHQLGHDLVGLPDQTRSHLRYASFRPSLIPVFAATLERTYEATLDCPELNGKRTIEEILAGHRGQGTFHPDLWWLAYQGDEPIGVVMVVEMPDGMTWELAYLGIVPEHRGRGLGRALSLHALHILRARPATRLLLAVDERNASALRLYQSLGFVEIECNEVLLRFW